MHTLISQHTETKEDFADFQTLEVLRTSSHQVNYPLLVFLTDKTEIVFPEYIIFCTNRNKPWINGLATLH